MGVYTAAAGQRGSLHGDGGTEGGVYTAAAGQDVSLHGGGAGWEFTRFLAGQGGSSQYNCRIRIYQQYPWLLNKMLSHFEMHAVEK